MADVVSDKERLLEGLVMKLMQEHGIDKHAIPSLLSCGCEKCLIMAALYKVVAPMVELMSSDSHGLAN